MIVVFDVYCLIYWLCLSYISTSVSGATLQQGSQDISSPSTAANLSKGSVLPANLSLPSSNDSSENALEIECNAILYGKSLKPPSCYGVFQYLTKGDQQIAFAERKSGLPFDIPLPYRVQSNDGLCFIQIILVKDAIIGKASQTEYATAASALYRKCVTKYGYGGIANRIGGDNKLDVVISSYKPNIKCTKGPGSGPPWRSCVAIFTDMYASKDLKIFGHPDDGERVQVELPYYLKSSDRRCQVKIDKEGPASTSSWYEIWEAVNALAYMCVKAPKTGGRATKIGSLGNIYAELSDENPQLGQLQSYSDSLASNTSELFAVLDPPPGTQNFSAEVSTDNDDDDDDDGAGDGGTGGGGVSNGVEWQYSTTLVQGSNDTGLMVTLPGEDGDGNDTAVA